MASEAVSYAQYNLQDVGAYIQRQVEFYFSDSYLPRDNELWKAVQEASEGYIPLQTLCEYPSLHGLCTKLSGKGDLQPATITQVAGILKGSPGLQLDKSKDKIRRVQPLPDRDEAIKAIDSRTVHTEPLPFDCKPYHLAKFFIRSDQPRSIRLLPNQEAFKGHAFVELASKEMAEKVIQEAQEKPSVYKFHGAAQKIVMKATYIEQSGDQELAVEKLDKKVGMDHLISGLSPVPRQAGATEGELHESDVHAGSVIKVTLPAASSEHGHHIRYDLRKAFGLLTPGVDTFYYKLGDKYGYLKMFTRETADKLVSKADENGLLEIQTSCGGQADKLKVELRLVEGKPEEIAFTVVEETYYRRSGSLGAALNFSPGGHVLPGREFGRPPFSPARGSPMAMGRHEGAWSPGMLVSRGLRGRGRAAGRRDRDAGAARGRGRGTGTVEGRGLGDNAAPEENGAAGMGAAGAAGGGAAGAAGIDGGPGATAFSAVGGAVRGGAQQKEVEDIIMLD